MIFADWIENAFILCQWEVLLEHQKYRSFPGNGCKQSSSAYKYDPGPQNES